MPLVQDDSQSAVIAQDALFVNRTPMMSFLPLRNPTGSGVATRLHNLLAATRRASVKSAMPPEMILIARLEHPVSSQSEDESCVAAGSGVLPAGESYRLAWNFWDPVDGGLPVRIADILGRVACRLGHAMFNVPRTVVSELQGASVVFVTIPVGAYMRLWLRGVNPLPRRLPYCCTNDLNSVADCCLEFWGTPDASCLIVVRDETPLYSLNWPESLALQRGAWPGNIEREAARLGARAILWPDNDADSVTMWCHEDYVTQVMRAINEYASQLGIQVTMTTPDGIESRFDFLPPFEEG